MGATVELAGNTFDITTAGKARVDLLPFGAEVRKRKGKQACYINDFGCFDIETTSVCTEVDKDGDFAAGYGFMYIWQFYSQSTGLVMGHYWNEFILLLKRIHGRYQTSNPKFVIYVHNLPFEAVWLFDELNAAGYQGKVFATAPRKPILFSIDDLGIEFRCSLKLTNRGLAKYLSDMHTGYEKLTGDLNYRIARTPKSYLDPKTELAYCAADVVGLYYAIKADLEHTGDTIASVPLTSTGYVRRDLRKLIEGDKNYEWLLKRCALTPEQYQLVKFLAKGGDTLGAASQRLWHVCYNIASFDYVSSYPAQLLTRKYPLSTFELEGKGKEITLEYLHQIKDMGRFFICKFEVTNVELKLHNCPIPCITRSKDLYTDNELCYNGRLLRADRAGIALDMISFEIFEEQYKWDSIEFGEVYSCEYGYLPQKIRDFIYGFFVNKCKLKEHKASLEKGSPEWIDASLDYDLWKNLLNGIFGMFYTDCLKGMNTYDFELNCWNPELPKPLDMDEAKKWLIDYIYEVLVPQWEKAAGGAIPEEELAKKIMAFMEEQVKLNREALYRNQVSGVSPYMWGCVTASHGRARLWELIKAAGFYNVIYSDTDSIKVKNCQQAREGVAKLNEELTRIALECGAYYDSPSGKRYILGVAEDETGDKPYLEFVTGGAKKYCYRDEDGLHHTVSGVAKDQVTQLKDDIKNFAPDFKYNPAGGILLHYIEQERREIVVHGDDGTEDTITLGNNIYCEERKITLGRVVDDRFGENYALFKDMFTFVDDDDPY